jgi:2-oxo-4-hydroxy-4-carboxy--5-ureidoimidazoline (OHCU) decarboxylase
MAVPSLPDVSTLVTSCPADVTNVLDALFEPSSALHAVMLPTIQSTPFDSYDALIDSCHAELTRLAAGSSSEARRTLHSILGSHPRLGAKKVDSAQSSAEQARLHDGDDGVELAALNAEYEARFPGLRYVVFVNGRGRPEIMENMRSRIARGDIETEEHEGIQVWHGTDAQEVRKDHSANVFA